jgi:hypothetical protein
MIRIAITAVAFEAIAGTLPLGSVGFEPVPGLDPGVDGKGQRLIWREAVVIVGRRKMLAASNL